MNGRAWMEKLAADAFAREAARNIMRDTGATFSRAMHEVRSARVPLGPGEVLTRARGRVLLHPAEEALIARQPRAQWKTLDAQMQRTPYAAHQDLRSDREQVREAFADVWGKVPPTKLREAGARLLAWREAADNSSRRAYEHLTGQHGAPGGWAEVPHLALGQPKGAFMFRGLTHGADTASNTFVTRHPALAAGYAADTPGAGSVLAVYRKRQFRTRAGEGPHGSGHYQYFNQRDPAARAAVVREDSIRLRRSNPIGRNPELIPNYEDIVNLRRGQERPFGEYRVHAVAEPRRDPKGNYQNVGRKLYLERLYGPAAKDVVS